LELDRIETGLFFSALFAVAADFRARRGDLDAAIFFDLLLQLLVEVRLELADGSAFQARDVDVVTGTMAFVEVLISAQVEQVELVDQAVALEQIDGPVDGHAVDARVELLRAIENGAGVEMALGVVHDLEKNLSLARQAHAPLGESLLEAAGAVMGVNSLAGGDSMCCGGHDMARAAAQPNELLCRALRIPRARQKSFYRRLNIQARPELRGQSPRFSDI
jgi:hypothetical protein